MGMSIDKAIPKIQFIRNALNDDMEIAKAYDLAIEVMRKYQKIEHIVKAEIPYKLVEIEKVIKDGNDI